MQDHEFRDFVARVKLAAPIEEVVRTRVERLKRAGRLWEACCPFHDEKTPSFKVDPDRGTWRCYGACSDGGDVISFLQQADNATFLEALETAAQIGGVPMPEGGFGRGKKKRDEEQHQPLYDLLERAEKLYRRHLVGPDGAAARRYLEGRQLAPDVCDAFGIGWAPDGGSPLLASATSAGVDPAELERVGLVKRRDDGSHYDFFYNRIVIPIRDDKGRTVGFGARALPESQGKGPKYVNTPETELFHKGRLIYGYDLALGALRKEKRLVLVEGYTDVMGAHQAGYRGVCAVLGTSTTTEHAALVRRTGVRRVTLVFDGDEAGARATRRALVGLLPLGVEIDVAPPPDGQDPCDLCVRDGGRPFAELLDAPVHWVDFLAGRIAAATDLDERALTAEVDELLEVVRTVRAPVAREHLLGRIAEGLGFDVGVVKAQLEDLEARRPRREERGGTGSGGPAGRPGGGSRGSGGSGGSGGGAWFPGADGGPPPGAAEDPGEGWPGGGPPGGGGGGADPDPGSGGGHGGLPPDIAGLAPPRPDPRDRLRERRELKELKAFRDLAGALLADNSLIRGYLHPEGEDFFVNCPDLQVRAVVETIRDLYYKGPEDTDVDAGSVAAAAPEGIDPSLPARLEELARNGDAAILADDSLHFIRLQDCQRAVDRARAELAASRTEEERTRALAALTAALQALKALQDDRQRPPNG